MGKNLIIKGADFSENAAFASYTPKVAEFTTELSNAAKFVWTLTDSANELAGKTIVGFEVQWTNNLSNATKTAKITLGQQIVEMSCEFAEGETIKKQTYMLNDPYTFVSNGAITYEVTGNVSSDNRGGCDLYVRTQDVAGTPQYAFTMSREGVGPISGYEYMPFAQLLLAL